MSNEILFITFFLILCIFNITAFRFGKTYMYVLIAVYTVLMNIFVTKQYMLFGFAITGGNALYGATFLLTDLLSEHYGKKEAFKAVAVGFLSMIIFVISTQFLIHFTPNEYDYANESIKTIFSITPRILLGSLLAYFIAQNIDVFLYEKIKLFTKGKYLFLRNNGSTMISQAIDTLIFTFVGLTTFGGFTGVIELNIFWEVAIATYVIKLIVALIDTPFMYLSLFIYKKN
ncbi:MAG: queuosine precursor transporter [Candidatus Gracilibacteria bacterium]|nr:queuosine precursor transporter [Candidatus Gracilibacteria bacterium]